VRDIRSERSMPSIEWWVHQTSPTPGHIYGLSADWARSPKGDYTAVTVFDFTTAKQVALFRWRGEDFTDQMEAVLAIQNRYGAQQLHSDANGVGMMASDFMRKRHALGFIAHRFGKNKEGYVTRGRILFQDVDLEMIDCPEQKNEFKIYSAVEAEGMGSEKKIQYCAPLGEHDDIVSAFLQLAPTLTIIGRQAATTPEPETPPMFDKKGRTTLALFAGDHETPWSSGDGEGDSWNDVVLPPGFN